MSESQSRIFKVSGGHSGMLESLSFDGRMDETELETACCSNPGLFGEELLLLGHQLVDCAEDS
jgi:hypothetical protein